MGPSISTSKQTFRNNVETTVKNSCPSTNCLNEAEIGDVTIGGKKNKFNINQRCKAESKCLVDSAVKLAAQSIANAKNEAKAGLGVAVADTEQDIEAKLKTTIENDCGSTEARNKVIQRTVTFTESSEGNEYNLTQAGDAKSDCSLATLAEAVSKVEGAADTKASGLDPTMMMLIIGVVFVFLIIGGGVALYIFW